MMTLLLRSHQVIDVPGAKHTEMDDSDLILLSADGQEVMRQPKALVIAYGRADLMRNLLEEMSRPEGGDR
jgi:hypothetical protein